MKNKIKKALGSSKIKNKNKNHPDLFPAKAEIGVYKRNNKNTNIQHT